MEAHMTINALQDNVPLLKKMMADMNSQNEVYRPGPLWSRLATEGAKALKRYGLGSFRSSGKATAGAFANITDAPMLSVYDYKWASPETLRGKLAQVIFENGIFRRILLDRFDKALRLGAEAYYFKFYRFYRDYYVNQHSRDWFSEVLRYHSMPNTMAGGCIDGIRICDQIVAPVYFVTLARIFNFHDHIDFRAIKTVFIIGGGFGYEAHLIMSLFPNIKKCITLDIPPTLYVQTQYLRAVMEERVIDYAETCKMDRICFSGGEEREIIAIAPWQIENVDASIDLLWNSCSFQEMTPAQVRNYALFSQNLMAKVADPKICLAMYGDQPFTAPTTSRIQILDAFAGFSFERIQASRKFWPLPPSDESYEEFNYIGRKLSPTTP